MKQKLLILKSAANASIALGLGVYVVAFYTKIDAMPVSTKIAYAVAIPAAMLFYIEKAIAAIRERQVRAIVDSIQPRGYTFGKPGEPPPPGASPLNESACTDQGKDQ